MARPRVMNRFFVPQLHFKVLHFRNPTKSKSNVAPSLHTSIVLKSPRPLPDPRTGGMGLAPFPVQSPPEVLRQEPVRGPILGTTPEP